MIVATSAPVRHGCPGGIIFASGRPLSDGRPYSMVIAAPSAFHSVFTCGLPPPPVPVSVIFCAASGTAIVHARVNVISLIEPRYMCPPGELARHSRVDALSAIRQQEPAPGAIRGQRLGTVVAIEDRRIPREQVRVRRGELLPRHLARVAIEPLADEHHEGRGDRLVVALRLAPRRREAPQRALEVLQRDRPRVAPCVPPGDADVLGMMESTRRLVSGLEEIDQLFVGHYVKGRKTLQRVG